MSNAPRIASSALAAALAAIAVSAPIAAAGQTGRAPTATAIVPAMATKPTTPATAKAGPVVYVVVFDFAGGEGGKVLADKVRLRLRRHRDCQVIDRLTTREFASATASSADPEHVAKLIKALACQVGVYGSANRTGQDLRVEARCIDLRNARHPGGWAKVFTDSTERREPVVARQIVEAIRSQAEWTPPQYGDEPEPPAGRLGRAINVNGDFERGSEGWDAPDNVSTFLEAGDSPGGPGRVLRVRTDLARDPWLAYRRKLRLGQTDPAKAPTIARDTSYGSVAGLEGVHYRSAWIKATPGQRYWLLADCKGLTSGMFFPKVFVKGFRDWSAKADGLSEASLAELGLTPKQFADLPKARRSQLIAADTRKHPQRHRRECYRWYLACRCDAGWNHFAAPFPPRGGLPKNVQWLQIQIYSYWPPGTYLWDNVHLHLDPNQKAPVAEEPARTPNFDKR